MTESRPTAGVVLARKLRSPWRGRTGGLALLLLGTQMLWRGALLGRGYFTEDDFKMLNLAHQGLSVPMLVQDYAGHLFPGGFLIAWAQATAAPLDWTLSVVVVLILQLFAATTMWMVLRRLLGESWLAPPLYAVFLFSPLTLWSTQWWAVAIQFLPVAGFLCLAVWALLCRLQDGARWGSAVAVMAVLAALLFQERGVLIPIVLGFVAIACAPGARLTQRLRNAVRAHLGLWLTLVAIGAGYVVLHRDLAPIRATTLGSWTDVLRLIGNFLGRNLLPGLFGGSWTHRVTGNSLVVPSWWAVGICLGLSLALVVPTCRRGGVTTACGWLLIVVYGLVDVLLLFGGRTGDGPAYALIPRYAADAVPAAVIGLGLVALGVTQAARGARTSLVPSGRQLRRSVLVTLVYVLSAAVTTTFWAPHQYNTAERTYIENLRGQLRAHPEAVLYDQTVPDDVMIYWFGKDALLSRVVGIAPEDPVFNLPSYQLRMVDSTGLLRRVTLLDKVQLVPSADTQCGYHVTDTGATLPLAGPASGTGLVMRIGYFSGQPGTMTVTAGPHHYDVPVRQGLQAVDLVVSGDFDSVRMTFDRPGTVCVPAMAIGKPYPGERG